MTPWEKLSDEACVTLMRQHWDTVVGNTRPVAKSGGFDQGWFDQLSFINILAFANTFKVARSRGLLTAVEVDLGEEVLAQLGF